MTYSARPNFRTDNPGDLWWRTRDAGGQSYTVHASTGNQFVRALQEALRTQIPISWTGPDGTRFNRTALNVDGRWGQYTQSGLIEWARQNNVSANLLDALRLQYTQQNPRLESMRAAAWLLFHRVQNIPIENVDIKPETYWPAWNGINPPPRGSPLLIVSWTEGRMTPPTNYQVAPTFGGGGGGSQPVTPGMGPQQGGILPADQQAPGIQPAPAAASAGFFDSPGVVAGVALLGAGAVVLASKRGGGGRRKKKKKGR